MRRALGLATVLSIWAASPSPSAAEPSEGETSTTLAELGFDAARARHAVEPEIGLPFSSRSDRLLAGGSLELRFAEPDERGAAGVTGLVVLLNHEEVATLGEEELTGTRVLELDERLFGRTNLLSFRISTGSRGACGEVPVGSWRRIESGRLKLRSVQLPVESDLSSLPMPWLDRGFDRPGEISIVFARAPNPEMIRLAALAAGWLGREGGMPIRFRVSTGSIPSAHSLVLVSDPADAVALGLPPPEAPSIRVAPHPGETTPVHRILLLGGRTPAELEAVVRRLGAGMAPAVGELLLLEAPPDAPRSLPYDATRWSPSGRALRFSEIPGGGALTHRGIRDGSSLLRFRVAPDLFVFPEEFVDLHVDYEVKVPAGVDHPAVNLELNGDFIGKLATSRQSTRASARFRIHRSLLRGFNELRMHVAYPDSFCAEDLAVGADAEVRLLGSSVLHLEGAAHFRELPDLPSFIHDGYPFTRISDLGETALVLPPEPAPEEIGSALSMAAWFASITGDPGTRLEVLGAAELEARRPDKDLLIVARSGSSILRRLAPRLPVEWLDGRWVVSIPEQSNTFLEWAGGLREAGERERAAAVLSRLENPGIVAGMESPYAEGRTAVVLTAATLTTLPDVVALQGHATSSGEGGDLFLVKGDERWSFRTGTPFHRGKIDAFTHVRWVLSGRWLVLIPLLFGGAAIAGLSMRPALERRARARLSGGEDSGR